MPRERRLFATVGRRWEEEAAKAQPASAAAAKARELPFRSSSKTYLASSDDELQALVELSTLDFKQAGAIAAERERRQADKEMRADVFRLGAETEKAVSEKINALFEREFIQAVYDAQDALREHAYEGVRFALDQARTLYGRSIAPRLGRLDLIVRPGDDREFGLQLERLQEYATNAFAALISAEHELAGGFDGTAHKALERAANEAASAAEQARRIAKHS